MSNATVIKLQTETEDLIQLIFLVTTGVFIFLLLVIAFINRLLFFKLWQPFYSTLQQLPSFNVNDGHSIQLARAWDFRW